MKRSFNRNMIEMMDERYTKQQTTIKNICKDLNLVAYYPDYHADKIDKNTVIIYTKEGHKYNEKLSRWASVDGQ